ncbi:zinc ribbon domain-containing protein [Paenibacillus sp. GSMTC-2017]|uniref:zinc ribbon domain-containing protein n=1 Tax=Paenibacillus sp. GSMTC-2017 TaxID=2794350 RepID=UPI0018D93D19|nr:zinc ribbon domain-containing protein [Paenibacillus sp. GSMTC-2017]MBH5318690.1 zinc ribbon domain-containing protein [Paenibacillus sp. GSMTC-2017]
MPTKAFIATAHPLNAWVDVGATTFVLLLAVILVGAMFLFIRVSTDDSDKYKQFRDVVETIFGTPAHLRPGQDPGSKSESSSTSEAVTASKLQTFQEPCPACGEEVTERDIVCPACELRLL